MRWHWQYLVGFFLVFVNVDVLIIFFRLCGFGWVNIFYLAWPIAILETCAWWWFWQRFKKKIFPEILAAAKEKLAKTKEAKEGIGLWKRIKTELENEELWHLFKRLVIEYFLKLYTNATDKNSKTIKSVKKWGHLGVLIMGILPLPGTRSSMAIFCAITKWRSGFAVLLISDTLHVASMILGWRALFYIASKMT